MKKSILIIGALALPLVACNGPEKGAERLDSDASVATEEVQEELDPNDPAAPSSCASASNSTAARRSRSPPPRTTSSSTATATGQRRDRCSRC